MTLRARRWYYSIAILIFLIAAPLLVATAAGWRWQGWRQGFVQTGTLLITASDRLTVSLNGQLIGTTPKHLSGLTPGNYHLQLERTGYQAWDHLVSIRARTTTVIGPVRLFSSALTDRVVTRDTFDGFITDPTSGAIAGWRTIGTETALQLIWPTLVEKTITLPTTPTWIRVSPRRQRLAIGLPNTTQMVALTGSSALADVSAGEPVAWLPASENIVYHIRDGQLSADDALTGAATPLATASSMLVIDQALWYSSRLSDVTTVYQQSDATAAPPRLITNLNGDWRLVGRFGHTAIVQERRTGETVGLTLNRLTSRLQQVQLNGLDRIVESTSDRWPLWISGADVLTLSAAQEPVVLLRSTDELVTATWVEPGNILATLSATEFVIRSVSARQGRSTLFQHVWTGDQPLVIDPKTNSVLVAHNGQLVQWRWR